MQLQRNNKKAPIIIKNRKTGDNAEISLENVKGLFKNKNYDSLIEFNFPFMTLSQFNDSIYPINLEIIRSLFFIAPYVKKD